jgi:hypothetical protein
VLQPGVVPRQLDGGAAAAAQPRAPVGHDRLGAGQVRLGDGRGQHGPQPLGGGGGDLAAGDPSAGEQRRRGGAGAGRDHPGRHRQRERRPDGGDGGGEAVVGEEAGEPPPRPGRGVQPRRAEVGLGRRLDHRFQRAVGRERPPLAGAAGEAGDQGVAAGHPDRRRLRGVVAPELGDLPLA